jgi:hypothetical protein
MAESPIVLELTKVFQVDAAAIKAAHTRARIIHQTQDIDAAGDEVERAVRRSLAQRLPVRYRVGHGHVVDKQLKTSPQLDVIVSDGLEVPVLFSADNETEYIPYESVYAIGEVKATYYSEKRPIEAFSTTIARVKGNLSREETPPGYLPGGVQLKSPLGISTESPRPLNPLFSFMFFCNAGNFDPQQVESLYRSKPATELPNVVCLLDAGLILYTKFERVGDTEVKADLIQLRPEQIEDGAQYIWTFRKYNEDGTQREYQFGANFGIFFLLLLTHLNTTTLMHPNLMEYIKNLAWQYSAASITLPDDMTQPE